MSDALSSFPQRLFVLFLMLLLAPACEASKDPAPTQGRPIPVEEYSSEERPELGKYFGEAGVDGTFVMLDPQAKKMLTYNAERAREPFLPASIFKVPHALIALDTGVVDGPDFAIRWDPSLHPRQQWWPEVWASTTEIGRYPGG